MKCNVSRLRVFSSIDMKMRLCLAGGRTCLAKYLVYGYPSVQKSRKTASEFRFCVFSRLYLWVVFEAMQL